jgi:autotransporter-associated beta strand protein
VAQFFNNTGNGTSSGILGKLVINGAVGLGNGDGNTTHAAASVFSPIELHGDLTVVPLSSGARAEANTGAGLILAGNITEDAPARSITKLGNDTATFSGVNTYTGTTTVSAGKLVLTKSYTTAGSISATGGTLELASSTTGNNVLRTGTISAGGGKIDLKNNKAIVTGSTRAAVEALVASGRNGGTWDGNGIVTSRSGATDLVTGIAIALNSDLSIPKSVFGKDAANSDVPVTGSDVLLMYTYVGDADLDGDVDGDDYFRIDNGFSAGATTYSQGDFDYNGRINADDYFLIDRNYSRAGSFSLAPGPLPEGAAMGGVTAVPEPAGGAIVAFASATLLRRRRQR